MKNVKCSDEDRRQKVLGGGSASAAGASAPARHEQGKTWDEIALSVGVHPLCQGS